MNKKDILDVFFKKNEFIFFKEKLKFILILKKMTYCFL